jgi:hypothetical protein
MITPACCLLLHDEKSTSEAASARSCNGIRCKAPGDLPICTPCVDVRLVSNAPFKISWSGNEQPIPASGDAFYFAIEALDAFGRVVENPPIRTVAVNSHTFLCSAVLRI